MVLKLFDPSETSELLRGWQLHVIRRREIHEAAARRLQRATYWLGVPAAILSAIAGCTAFAAWQSDSANHTVAIVGFAIGIAGAIATQVQTFLDLGARAERHRQAAVKYKEILRTFERMSPDVGALPTSGSADALTADLEALESRLAQIDGTAPVVPKRLAQRIEAQPVPIATTLEQLVARGSSARA